MTDDAGGTPREDPLPILSVTLEGVSEDGTRFKIGRFLDFAQAEDVLRTWSRNQAESWPAGAPIRVEVEFPRRLVFARDLIADVSGRARDGIVGNSDHVPSYRSAGLMSLKDHVAVAMRLAFASREVSVEALERKRVARIVLAYGDPA